MKISQLIKGLRQVQKEHGDIESFYQAGDSWYSTDSIQFNVCNEILYFE